MSWKKLVTSGSDASLGSLTVTDLTVAPVGFGSLSFTSSISQSSEGTQNFLPSWYFHTSDGLIAHSDQIAANEFPDVTRDNAKNVWFPTSQSKQATIILKLVQDSTGCR